MAQITDTSMFRSREDILAEMLADTVSAVSDAYVGEDGNIYIVFSIDAAQLENLSLANQLILEDMFISTASLNALQRHGLQYKQGIKDGTKSSGTLLFAGDGGTFIPIGAEVAYDPGNGLDPIYFVTTASGTLPNPGAPTAPHTAINVASGLLNGTYEYVVTFVTAAGESLPSPESVAVNPATQKVDLTVIPAGGTGTTKRRIYRDKNGANNYRLVVEIADNTTTIYTDNIADATVAAAAAVPTGDTARQITLAAESEFSGVEANVGIGVITALTNSPATLTSVTNGVAFTGGTDQEDTETFRARLLEFVQAPGTGSDADLKVWAENVNGVDSATVFPNTPNPGETTVRISGPGGTVPGAPVIAATQTALDALDIANIIVHVTTFTPDSTDVTVDVTTSGTYVLADVTPSVTIAIQDYINSLDVGETLMLAGIIDAVFGLPGIADVVVTTPGSNQTTTSTHKRTPGTITVS